MKKKKNEVRQGQEGGGGRGKKEGVSGNPQREQKGGAEMRRVRDLAMTQLESCWLKSTENLQDDLNPIFFHRREIITHR